MELSEYNGYTNKPTWAVSLWLNNNQGDHQYWTDRAEEMLENSPDEEQATSRLAETLKRFIVDHSYPLSEATLYTDLLNFSLAFVEWREVAEGFINTAKEQ